MRHIINIMTQWRSARSQIELIIQRMKDKFDGRDAIEDCYYCDFRTISADIMVRLHHCTKDNP